MIIDLHSHYLPRSVASPDGPVQLEEFSDHVLITALGTQYRVPAELLDAGSQFRTSYGSSLNGRALLPPPFVLLYELDHDAGIAWSRRMNESVAATVSRDPVRLHGFGTVPLQAGGTAAAAELDHAVNALGLRGVEILTSVAGQPLVASDLDEFWEAADEFGAVVFIHPHYVAGAERLSGYHLRNIVGNPVETGIAAAQLILSPVLKRYRNLKIVLSHGGGILPGIFGRLAHAAKVRAEFTERDPAVVRGLYRRFFYDTVVFEPDMLTYLSSMIGAQQIVLGTDFPFDMAEQDPHALLGESGMSAIEQQSILERAHRLLTGRS